MQVRRYPVHGEPGVAWMLVFEPDAGAWFVDEITTAPRGRRRISLPEFEETETGKTLDARIRIAVQTAINDA